MTSKIKVDNITDQGGNNMVVKCGSTVTLGKSGDTVSLASGASQTGFGRTGTVDWQTGSIKTTTFTAANGEGYFADTSSGAITMNLPAGTAGNIVSVVDYTNTFQTHNLTITPNGSQKLGGVAASVSLSTEGQSVTLVYVDDTEGWKNVQDSTSNVSANPFMTASGGTETESGNCKIHTFTGPGTFTVSETAACAANNIVSYLVIAGGGGGSVQGGGGGAGGFREVKTPVTPYTASPLDGYPTPGNRITVSATAFPITVGSGGGGACFPSPRMGVKGSDSVFSTITSAGGGGGKGYSTPGPVAAPGFMNGGSGGGGAAGSTGSSNQAGTGNTPPTTPSQGNNGGTSSGDSGDFNGAGGGGAGGAGTNSPGTGGGTAGGSGATTSINGTPTARAGGGGGGGWNASSPGPASAGGGAGGSPGANTGVAGTANTGGGGGSSMSPDVNNYTAKGGNGGSGLVIIRYKFQ